MANYFYYILGFSLALSCLAILQCNAGFSIDSDNIMEKICNHTSTYIGRRHLSKCLFAYTPKKLLIIWEMCKKEVVGKVRFDELLVTLCDTSEEDKRLDWLMCQERNTDKGPVSKIKDGKNYDEFIYLAMKCMVMDVKEYD